METYIGTKVIKAKPMTRGDYDDYRDFPHWNDAADEGYLVEHTDGGEPNDDRHEGYISWSPRDVFEKAYRKTDGLTFGQAIEVLKIGKKVARKGWNGNDYLWLATTGKIRMSHAGYMLEGWLTGQDMLAEDWQIVE